MKTLICNLFGGPGAGKSTTRAGVFSALKLAGHNVEETTEFAKDCTWEERKLAMGCQAYLLGEQLFRLHRVIGKVRCVITDCPILLGDVYGQHEPQSFRDFVFDKFCEFNNVNFYINRVKKYNPMGRNQTLSQAKDVDDVVKQCLDRRGVRYMMVPGDAMGIEMITSILSDQIENQMEAEIELANQQYTQDELDEYYMLSYS